MSGELVDERVSKFVPGKEAVCVQQSTVEEVEDT